MAMITIASCKQHTKIKSSIFFSRLSIFLMVYLILINNVKNNILSLIAILICSIFILNPVYLLPPLFLSCLIGEYFVAFSGIGMARILTIIFIIGSVMQFVMMKTKFRAKDIIIVTILCVFNLMSASNSITGNITPFVTMTLNILLLFCMSYIEFKDVEKIIKSLITGSIILVLYIFFIVITNNASFETGRLVLDSDVNANILARGLSQSCALLYGILMIEIFKKYRKWIFIVLVVNIFCLLLTGSRSSFIAIITTMIIMVLIKILRESSFTQSLFIILITCIVILSIYIILSIYTPWLIQRFSISDIMKDGGSGRVDIWLALIKHVIPVYPLLGVGLGGENVVLSVSPYIPVPYGTHNLILTIITQVGIIGALIYFSFFINKTFIILKASKLYSILIVPLTMIFTLYITGIGEDIFFERILWFSIGLGLMLLNHSKRIITKNLLYK